jgi:hypothetical protein
MLMLYVQRMGWIPGFALLAAFILTFWSRRIISRLAATLYSVGALVGIGLIAYARIFSIWVNYHLTDGPPADPAILAVALSLPIGTVLYAFGAVALLWPGIPQEKALGLGKILHLIILPLLILIMVIAAFFSFHGEVYSELGWLVYAFLWFRIRESYNGAFTNHLATDPSGVRNLEPAQ